VVKVLLGWEQKEVLDLLAMMLRIGASQAMRTAFMEYAKSISLITERVREGLNLKGQRQKVNQSCFMWQGLFTQ